MNFGSNNAADDYLKDIKTDNSLTPFEDSVSNICWANNIGPFIATSSWDGYLRVFEVQNAQYGPSLVQKVASKFNTPLTKCCWTENNQQIWVGGANGQISLFDVATQQVNNFAQKGAGISSMHVVPGQNMLIAGGYENTISFFQMNNQNPVGTVDVGNKVYCSDFQYPIFAAGLANEKLVLMDVNSPNGKNVYDSSELGKHSKIESISINRKLTYLGIASFDGRANISSFSKNISGTYQSVRII